MGPQFGVSGPYPRRPRKVIDIILVKRTSTPRGLISVKISRRSAEPIFLGMFHKNGLQTRQKKKSNSDRHLKWPPDPNPWTDFDALLTRGQSISEFYLEKISGPQLDFSLSYGKKSYLIGPMYGPNEHNSLLILHYVTLSG